MREYFKDEGLRKRCICLYLRIIESFSRLLLVLLLISLILKNGKFISCLCSFATQWLNLRCLHMSVCCSLIETSFSMNHLVLPHVEVVLIYVSPPCTQKASDELLSFFSWGCLDEPFSLASTSAPGRCGLHSALPQPPPSQGFRAPCGETLKIATPLIRNVPTSAVLHNWL